MELKKRPRTALKGVREVLVPEDLSQHGPWGVPLGVWPHAPGAPYCREQASGPRSPAHLKPTWTPAPPPSHHPRTGCNLCMHPRGVRGPEGGEGGQTLGSQPPQPHPRALKRPPTGTRSLDWGDTVQEGGRRMLRWRVASLCVSLFKHVASAPPEPGWACGHISGKEANIFRPWLPPGQNHI